MGTITAPSNSFGATPLLPLETAVFLLGFLRSLLCVPLLTIDGLLCIQQAMFVVTTQLVGETFTVDEFEGMVADGAVRLVFLTANDDTSKTAFDSAISEGGYVANLRVHWRMYERGTPGRGENRFA